MKDFEGLQKIARNLYHNAIKWYMYFHLYGLDNRGSQSYLGMVCRTWMNIDFTRCQGPSRMVESFGIFLGQRFCAAHPSWSFRTKMWDSCHWKPCFSCGCFSNSPSHWKVCWLVCWLSWLPTPFLLWSLQFLPGGQDPDLKVMVPSYDCAPIGISCVEKNYLADMCHTSADLTSLPMMSSAWIMS